ncbi:transcription elongation factor A protein-like 8 [Molossus molossus]|uniref:transcription elongation factor A protein-like 8 n=1 Tax=Molossus molossus TaxID=27622 RepID=UPI0017468FAD|nr:transcription elongation factor A protein-like 8 [Molossus molossus]
MQKSCEENEGKPQNVPKVEEDHASEDVPQEAEGSPQPWEDSVPREAEGSPQPWEDTLTQPVQGFKEDTPVRHLDPEETLRGADELGGLGKNKKLRN